LIRKKEEKMMTLEKFEEASELVKKVTNPTKLIYSDYLSEASGAKVYLKHAAYRCV
jgi:threonine dehydratase